MKNNGIVTLSSIPTDLEQAKSLKAKIEAHRVTLHPEQAEKIMAKLEKVLSGEYQKGEVPMAESEFFNEFEEPRKNAREREAKRN
jgi:hypothetical protein